MLTAETLAELRRLLDAASPRPWVAFRAHDPKHGEPDWIGVTRDLAIDYDPDVFTSQRCTPADAELIATAINALPALLDAAAERDALADAVARVRELPIGPPSGGYYMVSMRDVRAALDGEASHE